MAKFIFISYINRSGSTLLLNMLSKLKGFFVCPESNQFFDLFLQKPNEFFGESLAFRNKFHLAISQDPQIKHLKLDKIYGIDKIPKGGTNLEMFFNLLDDYKNLVMPGAKHIVYKHNNLYQLMDKVPIIPGHKTMFITLIRDVRGIFASQCKTVNPYSGHRLNNNPLITAYSWNKLINHTIYNANRKNIYTIKFEDLISNNKTCIVELLKKLDISNPVTEFNRSFWLENRLPEQEKSLHPNINLSPVLEKPEEWKEELDTIDIRILGKISNNELKHFKYDLSMNHGDTLKTTFRLMYYKARIIFGLDHY